MAGKKDNIKALFSNSRSRVIILFTVILLVITIVIGVIKFSSFAGNQDADASLTNSVGGIQSTPGAINQTAQYAALQATQNIEQAELARKTGASAIPTIIRTHAFGEGVQIIGQKEGEAGVDFSALLNDNSGETQHQAWVNSLKKNNCSKASMNSVLTEGGSFSDLKAVCSCKQLKNAGYTVRDLVPICSCAELKSASFDIVQLKEGGLSANRLRLCGYTACDERGVGFTAQQMKDADFSDGELKGAGFSESEIARAGGLPDGVNLKDVRRMAGEVNGLSKLRAEGVTAAAIRRIIGSSPDKLIAAGFTAKELKNAGYSAADLKSAGLDAAALKAAGFTPQELLNAGFTKDDLARAGFSASEIKDAESMQPTGLASIGVNKTGCNIEALRVARQQKVSAETIKKTLGCDANAMIAAGYTPTDLRNAGFTAAELKNAGVSINDLKNAGYTAKELADAGATAKQLKEAGFTLKQLKEAGISAADLKQAGFTADQLKAAGFNAEALKQAGFSVPELQAAGFTTDQIKKAGFNPGELEKAGLSVVAGLNALPALPAVPSEVLQPVLTRPMNTAAAIAQANAKRIEEMRSQQEKQAAAQRYQQKIQQRGTAMLTAANQVLQGWRVSPQQTYTAGSNNDDEDKKQSYHEGSYSKQAGMNPESAQASESHSTGTVVIKTGDILFAVIDTSVNSDEPGPLLATIVSGKLQGSKLIGSFNLPGKAEKMIVTFNTLSIPGEDNTVSISAVAIDPNTARTALSSETDHHYLSRYGSLFASTFLEGFGNAFQSSNTTISIGGTGGTTNTTVQSGIGRSTMDNAVIGLATVGKAWGQVAAQNMTRPTTVQLFAGTGVGVLFTQTLKLN